MILDHLQGRHVVGIYPLLTDDTCWFLAADFDKTSWADDVAAFVETCRRADLPAAVERSRSGNGAHVWFFFAAPVAAATARKMGCYLITETMTRRHQLSMESYDRLFPNQDTLPRGGLGLNGSRPTDSGWTRRAPGADVRIFKWPQRDSNPCLPSATRFRNGGPKFGAVDSTPAPPGLKYARDLRPPSPF